jgi:hypothetical protein
MEARATTLVTAFVSAPKVRLSETVRISEIRRSPHRFGDHPRLVRKDRSIDTWLLHTISAAGGSICGLPITSAGNLRLSQTAMQALVWRVLAASHSHWPRTEAIREYWRQLI